MNRVDGTRRGIALARAGGVVWGRHGAVLAARNRREAQEFAESMRPVLLDLMRFGRPGPRRLARELNDRGIPARNGGRWHPATVQRLIVRLGPSFEQQWSRARDEVLARETGLRVTREGKVRAARATHEASIER